MEQTGRAVLSIVSAIVGLSIVAVILSRQAQTTQIISAASQGLAGVIGAATSPVGGGSGISNTLGAALQGLSAASTAGIG